MIYCYLLGYKYMQTRLTRPYDNKQFMNTY
jgi:hypothetical protein